MPAKAGIQPFKKHQGKIMEWFFLGLAIIGEIIGTSALKSTEGFTKLSPTLTLIAGYGTAFYFFSLALKTIPVGVAYAVWSAVGIVAISIIGYFVYNQKLDTPALIGISLIIIGVVVLQLFSKTVGH